MIPWLKENYGCEVIAVSGDVGQKSELDGLEEKALATGASYEDSLLGTSFARPIIAKKLVEI